MCVPNRPRSMQQLKVNIDSAVSITIAKTFSMSLKPLSGGSEHVFRTVEDQHVFWPQSHVPCRPKMQCSLFGYNFKSLLILNMCSDYIFVNVLLILFLFLYSDGLNVLWLAFVLNLETIRLFAGSCSTWSSLSGKLFKLQGIIYITYMLVMYERKLSSRILKKLCKCLQCWKVKVR
jgi:hypothetical protein